MEKINTKELKDYLYCPEFWFTRKKNNVYDLDFDIQLQRKRYEKRKRQYELYQKLNKELNLKKKRQKPKKSKRKTGNRRKQEDTMILLGFLGILFLGLFYSYLFYIFLGGLCLWFIWWLYRHWKPWMVKYLQRQLDPFSMLGKEKKVNPSLILYDFSNSPILFSKLNVIYQNNKFHIILDRSDCKLPNYLRLAKKSDLIELITCMKIFHTHFFTNQIAGTIKYQNGDKTILWVNKKNKRTEKIHTLLPEIQSIANTLQGGVRKNTKPLPYRCSLCPLAAECPSFQTYSAAKPVANEKPEETYERFVQSASNLLSKTSRKHWQDDAKELFKLMQSSSLIQKSIHKLCTSKYFFDFEELIETAAFHKKRLFNTALSKKDELTFAYQLLQYIAYKGKSFKLGTMDQLAGAYGVTKWYDNRTNRDQTIKIFFNTVLGRFLETLETELQSYIPKEKMDQIIFNLHKSQLNLANDKGLIRAVMNVNADDEIGEDIYEDDDLDDEEENDYEEEKIMLKK